MLTRSIRILLLLITSAAAMGANAATYYVRSGGDDSADGRSHETAWATIDKVNGHSFSSGDQILFHEGDAWQGEQLVVDSSGRDGEPVVIGAYFLSDGAEQRGVRGERPTIDGRDRIPSSYEGLVYVVANHVQVENLEVVNSEGRGIQFEDADSGTAKNNVVRNTYRGGIKYLRSDNGLIVDNHVIDTCRAHHEDGTDWDAAIAVLASAGAVVRGNTVEETYGEGININHGSTDTIVEDNNVFGARAVGIYSDASPRTTIRRNLVVGTADSSFWRGEGTVGGGIVLNNESYHYKGGDSLSRSVQSQEARIYANVVAFTNQGIGFWGQISESSFDNVLVYNNTLVDNNLQLDLREKPKPGSQFINNVLLSVSPGTKDVDVNSTRGMTAKSNYFSQGDPGGDLSDSGNRYEGLELNRMQGWRSIKALQDVSRSDFSPKAGAPVIGAGDPAPLAAVTEKHAFNLDLNLKPHNDPVDMGAVRFGASGGKVPGAPGALTTAVR